MTLRGPQTEFKSVEVLFGRRQKAHIVEHTPFAIICKVPQSEYEGIGYPTKVRIHVQVETTSGWFDVSFANNSDAWWEYMPTLPPTRVANVAATVFYKNNDTRLIKAFHLFANRLDRDWRFQFIVYTGVPHFFLNDPLVQEEMENGRLEIFERPPLEYKAFARAQLQPEYWEQMHGDRVLLFQADSVPCSGTIYKISDFYNYTYVGAPWCYFNHRGGNSGLSMRNKTAIIDLLRTYKSRIDQALRNPNFVLEDVLICLSFHPHITHPRIALSFISSFVCGAGEIGTDNNLGFAPKSVGLHFSVETEYSPKPWGIHDPWPSIHGKNWEELLESCPEIHQVIPQQYGKVYYAPCQPGR